MMTRRLTCGFALRLDSDGTLSAKRMRLKAQTRALKGLLASFALAIGAGLFSPAYAYAPTHSRSIFINDKVQALSYAKGLLSKSQFECLRYLYAKESGWQRTAYNKSGAYGIPQLKNSMIANMSGSMQVMYGIKYINHHRLYKGDTCKALQHWRTYGWH